MIETINKICAQLPEGWFIKLFIDNSGAWVDLVDPRGGYPPLPDSSDKTIVEQLNDALCVAKGWDVIVKKRVMDFDKCPEIKEEDART